MAYQEAIAYIRLVTQKAISENMIDLDTKEVVSIVKIIDLDAEVSAEKTMMVLISKIDGSNINMAMTLIN